MQYEQAVPAQHILLFRKATYVYDAYYPKQLDNGTTQFICREFAKRQIDFSKEPAEWSDEKTVDVATPSGFTNPILPIKNIIGYDFYRDGILFVLGEWDGKSWLLTGTQAKLMIVNRDLTRVEVLHDDIFSLAREAEPEATHIKGYVHFSGYGGKIVGALATYRGDDERSVLAVFDGSKWSGVRANMRLDTVQEGVVPVWDVKGYFIGWVTEGHSTNSLFIKISDLSISPCYPPVSITTTEPVYDMINRKVIWAEWGASEAYAQRIHVSDPDPANGCVNFKNVTPYGSVKDKEGHTIDLTIVNKYRPAIFKDNVHKWLVVGVMRGGLPEGIHRILKADLNDIGNASKWEVVTRPTGDDKLFMGMVACYDADRKPLPSPVIPAVPRGT